MSSSNQTWYTFDDDLKGYEWKYSQDGLEKTFPFYADNFTEFLFMRTLTEGGDKWVRVFKANVTPGAKFGSTVTAGTPSANFSASTVSSYDSSASKAFKWDLSASTYAPIIGNQNTESE